MPDRLDDMITAQLDLQTESFSGDPRALEPADRMEFIRWNVLALVAEMVEMLDETGWKPWSTGEHVNRELAEAEMVDAWHFFMNILLALSPPETPVETITDRLANGYFLKRQINAQRQADGYDGVTGKCPECHRDRATTELRPEGLEESCCPCGYVYH